MSPAEFAADTQPWWADTVAVRRRRLILSVVCLSAGALWEIGTVTGSKPMALLGSVTFTLSAVYYVVAIIYAHRLRVGLPIASPAACVARALAPMTRVTLKLGLLILAVWRRPAPSPQPPVTKAAIAGLWLFIALLVLGSAFFLWVVIHVGAG